LKIHTEGFGDPALIDHIATTREFGMTGLRTISRDLEGTRLSDHDGVTAALEIAGVA
jgi:endonuclease/exonuclease/phosphatase family metal-dependent hydrolase